MSEKKDDIKHINKDVSSDEKLLGAIAYIFLLFLVPLLGKRESEFAQFHAKQGLILAIAWFVLMILGMIPFLGWLIIMPLGSLFLILLTVLGILNAMTGKTVELPVIGRYARNIHLD